MHAPRGKPGPPVHPFIVAAGELDQIYSRKTIQFRAGPAQLLVTWCADQKDNLVEQEFRLKPDPPVTFFTKDGRVSWTV